MGGGGVNAYLGIIIVAIAAWLGYAWTEPVKIDPPARTDKPAGIIGDTQRLIRDGQAMLDKINAEGVTLVTKLQPLQSPANPQTSRQVCGPSGCYWQTAPPVVTIPESKKPSESAGGYCEPRGPLRRMLCRVRRS
jgi:hypothetical protein